MSIDDYSNMPACGIRDVVWLAGVARALPFPDASMDAVVCAFGIRNVSYVDPTFQEVFRAPKTDGRFFCLEVSHPWKTRSSILLCLLALLGSTLGRRRLGHPPS